MRRGVWLRVAAAGAVAGVLALGVPAAGVAAAPPGLTVQAQGTTQLVTYGRFQVRVPASWPVEDLAADPSRCVLMNRHAVYVGRPGGSQRCPLQAFGRTEALLVQPLDPSSSPALPTTALAPRVDHTWRVTGAGVELTATYGDNPQQMLGVLATATGVSAAAGGASFGPAAPATTGGERSGEGVVRGLTGSGLGFDPCTVPSTQTMTGWLASPYRVIGTYLGGVNWACTYGNFDRDWVRRVSSLGWQFIPIYVGLQASCSTIRGAALIDPAQAAAQGQAAADDAAGLAGTFGYAPSSPIYFDMEAYNSRDAVCRQGVLTFLGGWTAELHARGYLSAVYSSAASGISDLAAVFGQPGYQSPDAIWIASWNGGPAVADSHVPAADWAGHQRLKQYWGGHDETWAGATVNVDNDVIDGPVAGRPGVHATAARPASVLADPSAVMLAPGQSRRVALQVGSAGHGPQLVHWRVTAPPGIHVEPSEGLALAPEDRTARVTVQVWASSGVAAGRYDLPVTATAGRAVLAETFILASVTPSGSTPLRLYAADPASMAIAQQEARELALPPDDVVGSFSTAWQDLTGGHELLLAVGAPADDALWFNPCGWANPAGSPAGGTPFFHLGAPARTPPGVDVYENAAGATPDDTTRLVDIDAHYALAGTMPNEGVLPPGPQPPQNVCSGQPDVPTTASH